jgi:hypothetical protein
MIPDMMPSVTETRTGGFARITQFESSFWSQEMIFFDHLRVCRKV